MTKETHEHHPIAGRGAVMTGASSGIGRATAQLLAARGAKTGAMRVIHSFLPQVEPGLGSRHAGRSDQHLVHRRPVHLFLFRGVQRDQAYVSHLSRHMRTELGPQNIRVSMIEPGIVATELQSHWIFQGAKDWLVNVEKDIEFQQPRHVAEVVGFLACYPARVHRQQVTVMRQGIRLTKGRVFLN